MNSYQEKLLNILNSEERVIAMLAPSFPIDFSYPQIIGMLKEIGFEKVVELTFGAKMVNYFYKEYISSHSEQKTFITSPCPTVLAIIEKQYPELSRFLIPCASPMYAMGKICRKQYPKYKIVFISPCQAKRILEAPKYPKFIDLVITFKELKEIFEIKNIKEENFLNKYSFDSFINERTKIYPISGGLASSANIKTLFKDEEICITDGLLNNKKILDELKNGNSKYRFVDILNCDGGCIGGPDFANKKLSHEEKDLLIIKYREQAMFGKVSGRESSHNLTQDIDFSAEL